jgi:hypothetical protein
VFLAQSDPCREGEKKSPRPWQVRPLIVHKKYESILDKIWTAGYNGTIKRVVDTIGPGKTPLAKGGKIEGKRRAY